MLKEFFHFVINSRGLRWIFGGSLGGVIAVFFVSKTVFGLSIIMSVLVGIGILLLYLLSSFFYFYYTTHKNKHSPYGDAIVWLKDGFAAINELKRNSSFDSEKIMEAMVEMCNTLKKVFDKLTKVDCSISVKIPTTNEPINQNLDAVVENICRDYKHSLIRNTEEYKKQIHYVKGNTAYQSIISNIVNGKRDRCFYLNNNVPETKDYNTTSRPAYPDGILPYKSELVFPISPLFRTTKNSDENNKEMFNIWGFLCIDCNYVNKFNDHYHAAIIEGVADGIYDVIMRLNKSRTSNN